MFFENFVCALLTFNIRSEFAIKICARPLVKIDHVIFIYVTTPHSESAVLAITLENRALLTCIACSELRSYIKRVRDC